MNFSFLVFLQVTLALVQLDFEKVISNEGNSLSKRAGSQLLQARTQQVLFIADLEFGSNKDKVSLLIDTSSGDTIVPANDVVCGVNTYQKRDEGILESRHDGRNDDEDIDEVQTTNTCTSYGSFATGKSTSWKENSTFAAYKITRGNTIFMEGTYGSDTVKFKDQEIDDLTIIVLNRTVSTYGSLGLGLGSLEFDYEDPDKKVPAYNNFPAQLASQGIIKKNLYSIFLNSPDNTTGSILFGGVDLAKVNGSLTTVPFLDVDEEYIYRDIAVVVSGVEIEVGSDSITLSSENYPAYINAGSAFSFFPTNIVSYLSESLNGAYYVEKGLYVIGCPTDNSVTISLDFSGQKIQVPLSDLVLPIGEGDDCMLAIGDGWDEYYLGDNILRSAYLVFDLDERELSIGQAKYSNNTNIKIVSSTVPSATTATFYSSTGEYGNAYMDYTVTTTMSYPSGTKQLNSIDVQYLAIMSTKTDFMDEFEDEISTSSAPPGTVKPISIVFGYTGSIYTPKTGSGTKSSSTQTGSGATSSGASTASQSRSSSNSAPNSSSSSRQNDASTPILKLSCFITTIFAGLLIL